MPGGRPSLPGPWTETTRLPGPWGTCVLLLWKFRKQVDGRIRSWQFRADLISSRHFSVLLRWSQTTCALKIVGEGEREEGLGGRLLLFTRNSPDFPEVILCLR